MKNKGGSGILGDNINEKYQNRVSQALLDRIDLCVETKELSFLDMQQKKPSEASDEIRKRVEKVHKIQQTRYHDCNFRFNSQLSGNDMEIYCRLDNESRGKMQEKYEEYQLSARTYGKILKIARTIADMDDSAEIRWKHLEEAFCFRSPSKKYWR